ncbi:putative Ig domain-containing protein [Actinokineospora enzanensis]|uniref:putative Ig domain-containing protein n=1 Tax=Actinokineospora enzanensis TaxID=155975 RepID=UPI00037B5CDC|nr:putative Ig domain-containing protein [Actinokineospora enzanensis]
MRTRALPAALALAVGLLGVALTTPAAQAAQCGDQLVANGGFENGTSSWTQTNGVISASTQDQPAHAGGSMAWLDGYGSTHTDSLSQSVALPSGCTSATLTYWLHVKTNETTTSVKYDTLDVQVGSDTVASFSNLDAANGYVQQTVDVSRYLGQTVTFKATGIEDSALATDFVLDDVAVTTAGGGGGPQNPTVTGPGNQSTQVGQAVSVQVQASDPQNDTLTYSATGLPAGLSIGASTGRITGSPTTAGTSSVTVTATDPGGNTGSASFTWTVTGVTPPGDTSRTPVNPAYTVTLTSNSTGDTWTGHQSVSFTNASPTALPEVYLRLWDNAHGSCPTTPITVTNVTGGTASALTVSCTAMKVTLPTPLAQGQSGTIAFDLKIVVPSGADRFGHDGAYNMVGNALPVLAIRDGAGWHLDPYTNNGESFYTVISDFDVTLVHPTSLLTPATGTSTETTSGGTTTTHATAIKVRDFAWSAGPFSKVSGTSGKGVRVNVYGVSGISTADANSMLNLSRDAIDVHSGRFGDYPYQEVDVVLDNNFWFGGMEYPGFVMDLVSTTALPHELAHQWFYGIVGDDEYNAPWLDESFTDYATDLYRGINGQGCSITWQSSAEKLTDSMAYWDAHSSRYSPVIYNYGKCTLHDLRRLIGDTAMANLLKSYAQSHWYGISTTAEFKAAAQAAAGSRDLTSFWAQHRVEG